MSVLYGIVLTPHSLLERVFCASVSSGSLANSLFNSSNDMHSAALVLLIRADRPRPIGDSTDGNRILGLPHGWWFDGSHKKVNIKIRTPISRGCNPLSHPEKWSTPRLGAWNSSLWIKAGESPQKKLASGLCCTNKLKV